MTTEMNDSSTLDISGAGEPGSTQESASGTMRLDLLGAAQGAEAASASKKPLSPQLIVLGLIFMVGGGMLYGMRKFGMGPSGASANFKAVDYDVNRNNASTGQREVELIRDLTTSGTSMQVPPDQIRRNPFVIADIVDNFTHTPDSGETGETPQQRAAREEAERRQREAEARAARIQSELASIRVNGILNGPIPVALVNDKPVRVGDTIAELFLVVAITGRSVEVECEGQRHTIEMGTAKSGPSRPRGKN